RYFGLGQYLGPPQRNSADSSRAVARDTSATPIAARAKEAPARAAAMAAPADTAAAREQIIAVETPLYRAWFSSRGARLMGVELKRYATAHGASRRQHKRLKPGESLPEDQRVELTGEPALRLDLGSGSSLKSANFDYQSAESLDAAGQVRTLTFQGRDGSG